MQQPGVGRGLAQHAFHRRPGRPGRALDRNELRYWASADRYAQSLASLGATQDGRRMVAEIASRYIRHAHIVALLLRAARLKTPECAHQGVAAAGVNVSTGVAVPSYCE
jgi:hypothetical protein